MPSLDVDSSGHNPMDTNPAKNKGQSKSGFLTLYKKEPG